MFHKKTHINLPFTRSRKSKDVEIVGAEILTNLLTIYSVIDSEQRSSVSLLIKRRQFLGVFENVCEEDLEQVLKD